MSRAFLIAIAVIFAGCASPSTAAHPTPAPSGGGGGGGGGSAAIAPSLSVTNGLSRPVTVSISVNGHGIVMGEVEAQSTEVLVTPVRITPGQVVTLKAVTDDKTGTYSKDVALTGTYDWHVP